MLLWKSLYREKMPKKIIFSFSLILLCCFGFLSLQAIDLTQVDLSHQYDPDAPVHVIRRVVQQGGSITVYLDVTMDSSKVWVREFFLQQGYNAQSESKINPTVVEHEVTKTRWKGSITFPAPFREDLLVLRLASEFEFYFDIPIRNSRLPFPAFTPMSKGKLVLTNYLNSSSLHWTTDQSMLVSSYNDISGPAEAPMEEMKALAPVLAEDTLFVMQDSSFLKDYQFYFFRQDSATDNGLVLLKTPPYYPTFRTIGELIGPMKYLTTDAEFRALTQSNKPKRTFDEFWINTYGTKFRARNSIRKYFESVENANRYFTLYKPGWKTDQGMIFIVFGTPLEMYRTDNSEKWVYEGIEFEFIKVSTLFGSVYALRKDRKYEKDWYNEVGSIRKGE
jgi:GWxTD domain-containing protein